jgi:poly-gamma-glutamate capsule biosynthesis protein CapA/YwtB (metallophosphatase superfamily)
MTSQRAGQPRRKAAGGTVLVAADWAPIRAFEPVIRFHPEAVYGQLLPFIRNADLRIVNCECALTMSQHPVWKSGATFKGEPRHVRGLTAVPFDVACLANNHVLDYGVAGLKETLRTLDGAGVRHLGAGLTEEAAHAPLTLKVNGVRVHLVNFSEGEDLTAAHGGAGVFGWDIPRVQSLVRQCKKSGGVVIAVGHCGLEYVPFPPPYVVSAFRAVIDAGADCVLGHHPHVPQGMENYRGRPIFYSLGNFVFYQPNDLLYRKTGFFVSVHVTPRGVTGWELHPYRIMDEGLRPLSANEDRHFRRMMVRLSRPLATPSGHEHAWAAYLDYYGVAGFEAEVRGILERLDTEPQKAAAMFRNRVTTMQHAELWRDALTRMIEGKRRRPPAEAAEIVKHYFTALAG